MIIFKNFTKSYEKKVIYNNANFEIPHNKITCIIGGSGKGKTTLLNALANLTNYEGEIINKPNKVAYAFQEDNLIKNKTVFENLAFFTGETNVEKIKKLLEEVGLFNVENSYVSTLSGGEKQRVNVLRAIIKNEEVALYDEPFSSLDLNSKLLVANLIKNESVNKTAIIVTHDIYMASILSDYVVIINDLGITTFETNKQGSVFTNKEEFEIQNKILSNLQYKK